MKNLTERSNIGYYTPEVQRETAAATPQEMHKLDFEVSDFVQIRANAKKNIGRVGVIIGVKYGKLDKGGDALLYTVRFSDREAADYVANNLAFVKAGRGEI